MYRTNIWIPKGKRRVGGMNWDIGIDIHTLLVQNLHKIDIQKKTTVEHKIYSVLCSEENQKRERYNIIYVYRYRYRYVPFSVQ